MIPTNYDFSRIRDEAEKWVDEQKQLNKEISSYNHVFRIDDPNTNKPLAYLKLGRNGSPATAIMETFVYEVTKQLGLKHFAPTELITFPSKKERPEIDIWHQGRKIETLKFPLTGSIQPAIEGKLLHEYIKDTDQPLPMWSIAKAILRAVIIGAFDLHFNNIFITNDQKINYFDNARSMPNSEECLILYSQSILPSIRSVFFDFPQTSELLEEKKLQKMIEITKRCQNNLPELLNYLNSNQELIKKLPWGWLNINNSLNALKKRIESAIKSLEKMISSNKSQTLDDFLWHFNEFYRFSFAIKHLTGLVQKHFEWDFKYKDLKSHSIHHSTGISSIDDQIRYLVNRRYNIKSVVQCMESKNFQKMTKKIQALYLQSNSIANFVHETILAANDLVRYFFQENLSPTVKKKLDNFAQKSSFNPEKFVKILSQEMLIETERVNSIPLVKLHPDNFLNQYFTIHKKETSSIKQKMEEINNDRQLWVKNSTRLIKAIFYTEKIAWLLGDLIKKISLYEQKKTPKNEKKEFQGKIVQDLKKLFLKKAEKKDILLYIQTSIEDLLERGVRDTENQKSAEQLIEDLFNRAEVDNKDMNEKNCRSLHKLIITQSIKEHIENRLPEKFDLLKIESMIQEFFEKFDPPIKEKKLHEIKINFMISIISINNKDNTNDLEAYIEELLNRAITRYQN